MIENFQNSKKPPTQQETWCLQQGNRGEVTNCVRQLGDSVAKGKTGTMVPLGCYCHAEAWSARGASKGSWKLEEAAFIGEAFRMSLAVLSLWMEGWTMPSQFTLLLSFLLLCRFFSAPASGRTWRGAPADVMHPASVPFQSKLNME